MAMDQTVGAEGWIIPTITVLGFRRIPHKLEDEWHEDEGGPKTSSKLVFKS